MNQNKNKVLKISTAGSVDDGKSTLIGRILYDTHSLKKDQLEAIERSSREKGFDYLDFSLATDGLMAERAQGITIDVAHIYFSTPSRSYIIADTPGHVEYTRNMITGASTSDVSLILIDARNGVAEQTKRHYFISHLLRIKKLIVVVNKMDLVNYSATRFQGIVHDFNQLRSLTKDSEQEITFIPVSALFGENIVTPSENMPWYEGAPLMEILENIKVENLEEHGPARFQVQMVLRPKTMEFADFRGYAGKLKGNSLRIGDKITVLPGGKNSQIKTIEFYNQQYEKATAGSSITVTLEDELEISRGDLIVRQEEQPSLSKEFTATVCWMDHEPLVSGKTFFMQHGVNLVKTKIQNVSSKIDRDFTGEEPADELRLNDLGTVTFRMAKAIPFDRFDDHKGNGAFILIDPKSNATAGLGLIR